MFSLSIVFTSHKRHWQKKIASPFWFTLDFSLDKLRLIATIVLI
jgi:hypothetical protein